MMKTVKNILIVLFAAALFSYDPNPKPHIQRWHFTVDERPPALIPVSTLSFGAGGTPIGKVMYMNEGYWFEWRIPRREMVADMRQPPVAWIDFPFVAAAE